MNKILEPYIKMTEFLGQVLGENYEIVLYQIDNEKSEIVFIINRHITGRNIGDPIDELALKYIDDNVYKYMNYHANYFDKRTINRTKIKSSTFFIKDAESNLVGMLCINCNITAYTTVIEDMLRLNQLTTGIFAQSETIIEKKQVQPMSTDSISDLILDILKQKHLVKKEKLTITDKVTVITELYNLGVFKQKGTIPEVAISLKISEPSVYRYISRIKTAS